jgi:hypothetical protein
LSSKNNAQNTLLVHRDLAAGDFQLAGILGPRTTSNILYVSLVVVIVIRSLLSLSVLALLPDGNFDSLKRETLAQGSALADSGKLFRRVNLEGLAEALRKNRGFTVVDSLRIASRAVALCVW